MIGTIKLEPWLHEKGITYSGYKEYASQTIFVIGIGSHKRPVSIMYAPNGKVHLRIGLTYDKVVTFGTAKRVIIKRYNKLMSRVK